MLKNWIRYLLIPAAVLVVGAGGFVARGFIPGASAAPATPAAAPVERHDMTSPRLTAKVEDALGRKVTDAEKREMHLFDMACLHNGYNAKEVDSAWEVAIQLSQSKPISEGFFLAAYAEADVGQEDKDAAAVWHTCARQIIQIRDGLR